MSAVKIVVCGAGGRMGRQILALALGDPDIEIVGGVDRPESPAIGADVGVLVGQAARGVSVSSDLGAILGACDVVVDFTAPDAVLAHARLSAGARKAFVTGVTGLTEAQTSEIAALARATPVLVAPNMSVGINLLMSAVENLAAQLPGYDIEIVELHHRNKVDAPSGTALALGRRAAKGRGWSEKSVFTYGRTGHTGVRPMEQIGVMTLRGGDSPGEHTVFFAGPGERIELTHRASSRDSFASGALRAAKWLQGRPPKQYTMRDVLGL